MSVHEKLNDWVGFKAQLTVYLRSWRDRSPDEPGSWIDSSALVLRAFGLRAFGLRAFGLRAFGLRAFGLRAFGLRAFKTRSWLSACPSASASCVNVASKAQPVMSVAVNDPHAIAVIRFMVPP